MAKVKHPPYFHDIALETAKIVYSMHSDEPIDGLTQEEKTDRVVEISKVAEELFFNYATAMLAIERLDNTFL